MKNILERIEDKYGMDVAEQSEKFGATLREKILDTGLPERIGDNGKYGDEKLILYRFPDGVEALETNGDPVFLGERGFEEVAEECRKSANSL